MQKACLPMAKWVSNCPTVAEVLHMEFKDKCVDAHSTKVLGMTWIAQSDAFGFDVTPLPEGICITKRMVLSFLSRLFDPLRFVVPFVMAIKCLFQELWALGLQWDEELSPEYKVKFLRWVDGLKVVSGWSVPRSYTPAGAQSNRSTSMVSVKHPPKGMGPVCISWQRWQTAHWCPLWLWRKQSWLPWKRSLCLGLSCLLPYSVHDLWCLWGMPSNSQWIVGIIDGVIPWWHSLGSVVTLVGGRHLLPIESRMSRRWLLLTGGPIAQDLTILLICSLGMWVLRSWFILRFGCKVLNFWSRNPLGMEFGQMLVIVWTLIYQKSQLALFAQLWRFLNVKFSLQRDGVRWQRLSM